MHVSPGSSASPLPCHEAPSGSRPRGPRDPPNPAMDAHAMLLALERESFTEDGAAMLMKLVLVGVSYLLSW